MLAVQYRPVGGGPEVVDVPSFVVSAFLPLDIFEG